MLQILPKSTSSSLGLEETGVAWIKTQERLLESE